MNFRPILLLAAVFTAVLAPAARATEDMRFSKTLTPAQFTQFGLVRLSSDQLASLDALVRRDLARADIVTKTPRPARFSERLADDERQAAGLTLLGPAELAALDAQEQLLVPPPRTAYSVAAYSNGSDAVPYMTLRRPLEVHGEVSLMVGAGSHGYSEYGGAIAVEVDDPAHNLAIAIAYSELHTKGGWLNRGCRDGFSDYRDLGLSAELGK